MGSDLTSGGGSGEGGGLGLADRARGFGVRDLLAGLGVALVLIPQSLAYAELAGLPAYRGLYAAALAPIAAAFFASSPWLQTGPVALTSLLTLGALLPLAAAGSQEFVALAGLLALVVGGVRLLVGLFRLGWVAYLLSQPVLLGFTSAAALLIIGSQLPGALGVDPTVDGLAQRAVWTLVHPGAWEPAAVGLSLSTALLMLGSRRVHPAIPGVLLASLLGLGFSVLSGYTGPRVGEVPVGVSFLSGPVPWSLIPRLVLPGIVIAMVGFAEVASVSQTYATKERTPWDPDREFVSQGVANLASGIAGGFPVGGSFSRTSLAHLAGARTRWSGFTAGVVVLLFLPFSSVLAPLPKAVLSAVVISAVSKLIRLRPLLEFWKLARLQALIGWAAFWMTLALAPHVEDAVILSVALAIGLHLWRELTPGHSVRREGEALHLELRGVLWFGSAPILEKALNKSLSEAREANRVVVSLAGLGRIDVTGALVLKQLRENVERAGLTLELSEVPSHAHRVLSQVLGWSPP
jgi:SulP family sulfate permease